MQKCSDRIYGFLGLATKAGKTVSGEFMCEKAVQTKTAKLMVVSEEASDNTKKKFIDSCTYYNIPIIIFGTKSELGKCTGKEFRASVAITDENMAGAVEKLYRQLSETV